MTKADKDIRLVERECNIRRYTYTAFVCKRTGRLLKIEAGCRRWKTWKAAYGHYSHLFGIDKWLETTVSKQGRLAYAQREEAQCLLRKLRWDVERVQQRIRKGL